MIGGGNNDGSWDRGYHTWIIDFKTEQWTDGPKMKYKHEVAGCTKLDSGMIIVAGGEGKNNVEFLKPGASSWTDGKYFSSERHD